MDIDSGLAPRDDDDVCPLNALVSWVIKGFGLFYDQLVLKTFVMIQRNIHTRGHRLQGFE